MQTEPFVVLLKKNTQLKRSDYATVTQSLISKYSVRRSFSPDQDLAVKRFSKQVRRYTINQLLQKQIK